jgi:hypothetical protein
MKRLLILLALAGLGTAIGCGDDEPAKNDTNNGNTQNDAGRTVDAGNPGRGVQIQNVGAACSTNATCEGASATCETEFGEDEMKIELAGGYCTASCTVPAECGEGGGCPAGEIGASLGPLGGLLTGIIPSYCLDKCDSNVANACRTGYSCRSFAEVAAQIPMYGQLAAGVLGAPGAVKYCLPPITIPTFDGGLPRTAPVTGLDGGVDSGT